MASRGFAGLTDGAWLSPAPRCLVQSASLPSPSTLVMPMLPFCSFPRLALSIATSLCLLSNAAKAEFAFAKLAPAPAINQSIESNEAAFLAAVLAKDSAALEKLLSNDFVYVHENGWVSTKKDFLQNYLPKGYVHAERT